METGDSNLLTNSLVALITAIIGGLAVLWIWEARPILKRWYQKLTKTVTSLLLRLAAPTEMPLAGLILGLVATVIAVLLSVGIYFGRVDQEQAGPLLLLGSAALSVCWLLVVIVWKIRPDRGRAELIRTPSTSVFDKAEAALKKVNSPAPPPVPTHPIKLLTPVQTLKCKGIADQILENLGITISRLPPEDWVVLFLASKGRASEEKLLKSQPTTFRDNNVRDALMSLKDKRWIEEGSDYRGCPAWSLGQRAVPRIESLKRIY